ncbi:MAG: FkbM family methyltransferase [Xanthobacter sp.]
MLKSIKPFIETHFPKLFGIMSDIRDEKAIKDGEAEIRLLPLFVSKGDVVCDVGANRGLYTYWFLKLGAKVQAFEPNPRLTRIMRLRFARAMKTGQLEVHDSAASDHADSVTLEVPANAAALGTIEHGALDKVASARVDTFTVATCRLDDVVSGPVDFIKIDVEGHEVAAVDGSLGTLGRAHPTLLIEAEERHKKGSIEMLRARLEPLGYKGFFFDGRKLNPIESFDKATHQNVAALNEEGTGRRPGMIYYNNFIFAQRPDVIGKIADFNRN